MANNTWVHNVIERSNVKDATGLAVLCSIAYYADERGVVGATRENATTLLALATRARCSPPTFVKHAELAVLAGELAKIPHGAGRGAWVEYRLLLGNGPAASWQPAERLSILTDSPGSAAEQLSSLTDSPGGAAEQLSSLTNPPQVDPPALPEMVKELECSGSEMVKELECSGSEMVKGLECSGSEMVKGLECSGSEMVKGLECSSALPIRARARAVVVVDQNHASNDQQQQPTPRTHVRLARRPSPSNGRPSPRAAVAPGPAWSESAEYAALAGPCAALAELGMEEAAIAATLSIAVTHFGAAALPDVVRDWRAYIDRHANTIRNPAGFIRTRLSGGWPAPKQPVRADLRNLEEVIQR